MLSVGYRRVLEGGLSVAKPWVPPVADSEPGELTLAELKLLTDCLGYLRGGCPIQMAVRLLR